MSRKASLVLMEQLVMVLVFAVAAALCLGVFVKAHTISVRTGHRDTALWIAQNTAEKLKSGAELERQFSEGAYDVRILPEKTEVPGLARAEIAVSLDGEAMAVLTVGWQEVGP